MNNISDKLKTLFYERKDKKFITDTTDGNKEYTYGEFFNVVLNFSDFLTKNNIKNNSKICYIAENSALTLALEIAVLILNAQIVN